MCIISPKWFLLSFSVCADRMYDLDCSHYCLWCVFCIEDLTFFSKEDVYFYPRSDVHDTRLVRTSKYFTILIIISQISRLYKPWFTLEIRISIGPASRHSGKSSGVLSHTGTFQRPRKWLTESWYIRPMTLFVEWQNSDSAEFPKSPSPRCSHVLPARPLSQTNVDYTSKRPLTYHPEYYNKICQTETKTSRLLVRCFLWFNFRGSLE